MALPEVSSPAVKNMPNSPARSSSLSGPPVAGSRSRKRCAAIVASPGAGSPRAFTWAGRRLWYSQDHATASSCLSWPLLWYYFPHPSHYICLKWNLSRDMSPLMVFL